MEKELTLVMSFKNEDNKIAKITLKHIKEDITEEEISEAMNVIVSSNLFESSGGNLVSRLKAELVDKTTEEFTMSSFAM